VQPIKQLKRVLDSVADEDNYLFLLADLRGALPDHRYGALRAVVSRAERDGLLQRVCRGLYLYPGVDYPRGLLLYHAAAKLRAHAFNYISLESALSDAGVISQIPMHWVTLMSSGRRQIVDCGDFGTIEFVHTQKQPAVLQSELTYDARCHLWRATVALALRDMKATKRNMDLIDWQALNESI